MHAGTAQQRQYECESSRRDPAEIGLLPHRGRCGSRDRGARSGRRYSPPSARKAEGGRIGRARHADRFTGPGRSGVWRPKGCVRSPACRTQWNDFGVSRLFLRTSGAGSESSASTVIGSAQESDRAVKRSPMPRRSVTRQSRKKGAPWQTSDDPNAFARSLIHLSASWTGRWKIPFQPAIRSRSTVPTSTNSGVARRSTIQRDRRRKRIAEPGPIPAPAAREKQALFAGLCGKPAPTKSDTARNKGTNLSTAVRPSSSRRS